MRSRARANRTIHTSTPATRTESGRALEPFVRAAMDPTFGHDFASVRIHANDGAAASADALGALAYTVGNDVVFGSGQYAPDTPRGWQILAHELTHVVQNERHPHASLHPDSVTHTRDSVEREARDVSRQVMRGESVDVQSSPTAAVAPLFGWLEDAADWVGDKAYDAGSAVADGASAAWGGVKDAGLYIYDGMKQNAAYVRQGVEWAGDGIGWLEDKASSGVHWAADQVEDVPILGDLAQGGAWVTDQMVHLTGGTLKGATSLGGGLLQMAADPVDTVIGLESMAEHVSFGGMPNPLKVAHGLYNAATTDATIGDELGRTLNPLTAQEEDAKYWGQVAHGFAEPYAKDWEKGNYGDVVGRAGFDIASLFFGAGEANAALKGAEAATLVGDAARAAELGDVARAAELAEAARASEVASGAARAGGVSDVARGSEAAETARAAEAADVARGGAEASDAARGGGGGGAGGSGGGGGGSGRGPRRSEADRIADQVEREGRAIRKEDIRAKAREIEKGAIREDVESGIRRPETEALEGDIGRDNLVDLAEGEASLREVEAEVHHKTSLGEAPEMGDLPENLEALGKKAHREGAHGRNFGKERAGVPADPAFDAHEPLQSVRERGRPPLSPGEMDQAADAGAVEGWADRQKAIDDLIDRSRDPEALQEAMSAGKEPGKGRGGPRLTEEEQLARERAAVDKSIKGEYRGTEMPDWMRKAGMDEHAWEEAMTWLHDTF